MGGVASDSVKGAFLEDAQELGLQGKGKIADFVQEYCPTFCDFELALLLRDGTGEGSSFMAEELGFQQIGGKRSAVDDDERPLATGAVLVNRAGNNLFSGPGLS